MDIIEFEAAVTGQLDRIIEVKGTLQLNALLFSTEYTPENFAKKMNLPGNSVQGIDKLKKGLNTYEYFCNTLTGGYIKCTVSDPIQGQTGSGNMNPVETYFLTHKTQLWIFKHGLKVIGQAAVLLTITFVATHPDALPYGAALLWVLNEANKWLTDFKPDEYLPGVGARKK